MTASETIGKARQDYLDGRSVRDICERHQINRFTLYLWLDGGPVRSPQRLPPIARRSEARIRQPVRLTGSRATVAKHLWRATERQVRELENRLLERNRAPQERTADLESLLSLVKTYAELSELQSAIKKSDPNLRGNAERKRKAGNDTDSAPMELAELRRSLASRLAAIADDQDSEIDGGVDGGGDQRS